MNERELNKIIADMEERLLSEALSFELAQEELGAAIGHALFDARTSDLARMLRLTEES